MLSALKFDERFPHTDPYFGDMESEIAELRTMTRVTKLRQQIECRQEGAWMMVRDIPDERSSSGTRKVTTYGRATRSVTRSFTSDVNLGDFLSNGASSAETDDFKEPRNEAIVEFPEDFFYSTHKPKSDVEITEVIDNESKSDESEPTYGVPIKTSPTKKTSVVTLGQGNVVLIDPQDSNFKVTGMSKGMVGDEPLSKPGDSKKVKKVGFCKTEVHFAPDSGKVNIVETDEKPPSSQVLRRKKKPRKEVHKTPMPKLYFGDLEKEKLSSKKSVLKDDPPVNRTEHVFPVIREPSPLLSTSIANQARSPKEPRRPKKEEVFGELDGYAEIRRNRSFNSKAYVRSEDKGKVLSDESIDCVAKTKEFNGGWSKDGASFLRNVSPKLSKLISNNMQHEFQQKQIEILRKSKQPVQQGFVEQQDELRDVEGASVVIGKASVVEDDIPVAVNIHVSSDESQMKVKPVKIVAQVKVSLEERKAKAGPEPKRVVEPVYGNEAKGVTRTINVVREDEKTPKPKSSLTKIVLEETKERKRTKSLPKPTTQERIGRKSSTLTTPVRDARPKKDVPKREVAVVKPLKPVKSTLTRPEPCRRSKATSDSLRPFKAPIVQESVQSRGDKVDSAKSKKSKEPLRSFEKVSNGWVGHCIVPVKAAKGGSRVNITTTSQSFVTSSKNGGVKSDTESTEVRNPVAIQIENKVHTRSSLTSAKQFSLSKEHLKSAKLVKELYKGVEAKPDVPRPKTIPGRPRGEDRASQKMKSIVSRRRLVYEEGPHHVRRDSEQSDDSVIRADEEVRAYMFNSKSKGDIYRSIPPETMNASEMMDEMTASYSEICEQDSREQDSHPPAQETTAERPQVLDLLTSTQVSSTQEDRLSRLDGQVMKDGEMISFVADNLENKIKLSSPIAYVEPMWYSRLSEGEAKLLEELEVEASILAASVDSLTENLAETLHGISALTVDSLEVYRDVVCKTCDSVDTNIKAMYQLMAKCEEMSKSMSSVSKLAAHIKHIKHLLDLLEASPS